MLYHGGAPGFSVGDLIVSHEPKLFDDCAICAAGGDANHLPDRVFGTPIRLYAKHYASKWGRGALYVVESEGDCDRSDADPIETYHATAMRVVKVSERGVLLTMSERRHLYRLWFDADRAVGLAQGPEYVLQDMQLRATIGLG